MRGAKLGFDEAPSLEVELGVALGVVPDLVRGMPDAGGDAGVHPDVAAQEEERGGHAAGLERVQDVLRGGGARPVVEGEVERVAIARAAADDRAEEGAVGCEHSVGARADRRGHRGRSRAPYGSAHARLTRW